MTQRRSLGGRCGRRRNQRNPGRVGGTLYVGISHPQGRSGAERTEGLTFYLRATVSQARLCLLAVYCLLAGCQWSYLIY